MDTGSLKTYAPRARTAFIAAVSKQAAKLGITEVGIEPAELQGDLLVISEQAFPKAIQKPRNALLQSIERTSYQQVIEQSAYSWFNRFCAIRYMELHDYLGHGRRVLSHPGKEGGFQLLDECLDIDLESDLPGLKPERLRQLKLAGNQDETLYRELLLAQCHALHRAMPFLFEAVDDATELLLPENLTRTDSLIRDLVTELPEDLWQNIEIIGWLYQFYISEKKDQVIGKVVKSEDIPAATQLFTPNWIVKYMVQNSLGAKWLATYPDSPLKGQMDYYVEPAEQTDEVNAQLAAITPTSLNPEELTLIDPACGSGHILVEAYDLFKAIYLERGYRARDIPQLILQKNLFGLDIDERAAQLTGFALLMKGRADDRRLLERGVKLNVMALVDSTGFQPELLEPLLRQSKAAAHHSREGGNPLLQAELDDLTALKQLFEHATTFGSLIQVPKELEDKLPALKQLSEAASGDLLEPGELKHLGQLVQQAKLLADQYDAAAANPPYLAAKAFNTNLKKWAKNRYRGFDKDLFSTFIVRVLSFTKEGGYSGNMTSFVWMFISSYEELRRMLIADHTISSLVQLHYDAFEHAKAHVCAFVLRKGHAQRFKSSFIRLSSFPGVDVQGPKTLEAIRDRNCGWFFDIVQDDLAKIPGQPLAYWVSGRIRDVFVKGKPFAEVGFPRVGMQTANNDKYLRLWHEVDYHEFSDTEMPPKWIKYLKGGPFRRWYGNLHYVLRYNRDPLFIKQQVNATLLPITKLNEPKCTWTDLTNTLFNARFAPTDTFHDISGHCFYPTDVAQYSLLAFANTKQFDLLLSLVNSTSHFQVGDVGRIPVLPVDESVSSIAELLVKKSESDWDAYERSWNFGYLPVLPASTEIKLTLESSYTDWVSLNRDTIAEMKRLEVENNRLFIDAYGLQDELTPDVPIEQITLTVNPAYRYGIKTSEEERWVRFRQDSMQELVSYAIGCIMGRYSLDTPGLVYANSGNIGFDASQYTRFPADDDGIVPLTEQDWFHDDACNRLVEFIGVAWSESDLETNLRFLADNLKPKRGESSRETLRRYLVNQFFKDHLQTYKKRPIYWLFTSGKEKAFQALVYLHRYNEGTLARMRTEYVIPLTAKLASHVSQLENDKEASDSTAESKRLEKQITRLHKQQAELAHFDEKLRHYADQRIRLDLDDGVKVNYGKFGDLLADVKAIHGKLPETSQ